MMPTQCHWSIRVWRNVSFSIVVARPPGLSLRPAAAEAIAGGRLDTRLEGADDPDLEVLECASDQPAS